MLKGPTSFVAGSEVGELTKAISQDILGGNQAFANYMEENWGDYSDPTQRLISNWIVGTAFGFSHHMIPTRVPKGKGKTGTKLRWFNDWRSLSDINNAKDEAFDKNWELVDYVVGISPTGMRKKMSPEDFAKRFNMNSKWRIEEGHALPGEIDVRWELKEQPGDSEKIKQEKRDLQTRNEETYQIFNSMLRRAEGKLDLLDPVKGQQILEQRMRDTKKWFKKRGVDIKVVWGNNGTMGNKRGSYEKYVDPKTGKVDPKKVTVTFNVDQISLGLMPHEIGHAGLEALFTSHLPFFSTILS